MNDDEIRAVTDDLMTKWLAIGLSTEPTDQRTAEFALAQMYAAQDMPPPKIMWAQSLKQGALLNQLLLTPAGDAITDGDVIPTIADLEAIKRQHKDLQLWTTGLLYSQQDAWWLCGYDILAATGGQISDTVRGYMALARQASWGWLYEHIAILCVRPYLLSRDQNNDLHHETGPAIAWPDGWAMHSWHGTRMPDDFRSWDFARIMAEENMEIRRAAIEYYGWDNLRAHLIPLATAPDPGNPGCEIELFDLPRSLIAMYPEPVRLIIVTNGTTERDGTRRKFGIEVDVHHNDPVAAAAETYRWPVEAYRALARRA